MLPLHQIDAFASGPFTGNPAAVCLLDGPRPEAWMQGVAMEMNLSETAFLLASAGKGGTYGLRWFTPTVEVDLCGHATLASAHFLWEQGLLAASEVARFDTRSGRLSCRRTDGLIRMDFPARPGEPCEAPAGLLAALGLGDGPVLRNGMDFMVVLDDEAAVAALAPDMAALARVEARGVIVTAASARAGVDFVSRFFAPAAGVDEDPVTGSAHCFSAPYWAAQLGRTALVAQQLSRRGGRLELEVGDGRVEIAGRALTTVRGHWVGD